MPNAKLQEETVQVPTTAQPLRGRHHVVCTRHRQAEQIVELPVPLFQEQLMPGPQILQLACTQQPTRVEGGGTLQAVEQVVATVHQAQRLELGPNGLPQAALAAVPTNFSGLIDEQRFAVYAQLMEAAETAQRRAAKAFGVPKVL